MRRFTIVLCGFLLATASLGAHADIIKIPVGEQSTATSSTEMLPVRGMSQARVLTNYGEPISREAPVGQPPITRWRYADFDVVFENDWVIASVAHFKPKHPPEASADQEPSD